MMKRKIFAFLSAMLLAFSFVITAYAGSAEANVSSGEAHRGESVTLSVTLSESVVVKSGSVALDYDKSALLLVEAEWTLEEKAIIENFDERTNKGAFAYRDPTEIGSTVFTATFIVLDDAAYGIGTVSMTMTLKDENQNEIEVTSNPGELTVVCNVHDYSLAVVDEKYLATEANCCAPATYYYSCICGKAGANTFTYGDVDPDAHIFSDWECKSEESWDSDGYYERTCQECGTVESTVVPRKQTLTAFEMICVLGDSVIGAKGATEVLFYIFGKM